MAPIRRNLANQQPPTAERPAPKKKKTRSTGTLTNPYLRANGVEAVKATFRLSKACVLQYKQFALTLKAEDDIDGNDWLEALIFHGIDTGFLRKTSRRQAAETAGRHDTMTSGQQDSGAAEEQGSGAAEERGS